jgi:20S proteasome alpha/beta subunit
VSAYVTATSKLLYKYDGNLGAHLIVGGYDVLGPHLCMISGAGKYIILHNLVILIFLLQLWVQVHFKQ